jgi:hypothetical protein
VELADVTAVCTVRGAGLLTFVDLEDGVGVNGRMGLCYHLAMLTIVHFLKPHLNCFKASLLLPPGASLNPKP